ncbi:hypothetical protein R1sor_017720 [Riccia sorocarpa]|uniref:Tryptophan synthase n=1 Tax=Riccia sorocarpa TaxID=122646 RepID=A0ABD3I7V8_9MARC
MGSLVRTIAQPKSQHFSSLPLLVQQHCGTARPTSLNYDSSGWTNVRRRVAVRCNSKFGRSVRINAAPPKVAAVAAAVDKETRKISHLLEELRKEGKVALLPYLTAGDPNIETTAKAILLLDNLGASVIELGVPYSDPLADGPVIQAAATRALANGTTMDSVLELIREVAPQIKAPIVVFVYYNQLLRRGAEVFVQEAKEAGASGLVVPDLPLEETSRLRELTSATGLELVLLTTPTTPTERMVSITEASQGFVYLVSLTGVTGARAKIESRVEELLKSIKESTEKAVCVGFGISDGPQALQIAEWGADGVIIGSAVVKLLGESGTPEQGLRAVEEFISDVQKHLAKHSR